MTTVMTWENSNGTKGRCDAKCHGAKTLSCHCMCGGKYHGATHREGGVEQAVREHSPQQFLFRERLASFRERLASYEIMEITDAYVLIRDVGPWDKYPTITNAAEETVAELAPHLGGRRLEYIDSEGRRDQLLVKDGRFAGFAPMEVMG